MMQNFEGKLKIHENKSEDLGCGVLLRPPLLGTGQGKASMLAYRQESLSEVA